MQGNLSARVFSLVKEWALEHQDELLANWERARQSEPLEPIAPLE
ncbi:DUF4160 domain-containing protein [Phormidesmis priestleyi ULC007]|uniref:DUF4160 domain-containing protein n=1 Tax=Phormidesmis priestleyi ULC007 TaxID=1920490 RepID=A0A2T1D636_9CYAN|nr:DUF4160 domain-containing protein [Phormidesmis priestleyi ULC007]PZO53693.1 MAG: DUF4160 domain-containing protein [Phormidesmis priestleyi]